MWTNTLVHHMQWDGTHVPSHKLQLQPSRPWAWAYVVEGPCYCGYFTWAHSDILLLFSHCSWKLWEMEISWLMGELGRDEEKRKNHSQKLLYFKINHFRDFSHIEGYVSGLGYTFGWQSRADFAEIVFSGMSCVGLTLHTECVGIMAVETHEKWTLGDRLSTVWANTDLSGCWDMAKRKFLSLLLIWGKCWGLKSHTKFPRYVLLK